MLPSLNQKLILFVSASTRTRLLAAAQSNAGPKPKTKPWWAVCKARVAA